MNPNQPMFNPEQLAALREVVAPAGLWERIEAEAKLRSQKTPAAIPISSRPLGPRRLRGREVLRFLAAGLLGFLSFFGMEQLLTQGDLPSTRAQVRASNLHLVDPLSDNVPLVIDGNIITTDNNQGPLWPEVELATYFHNPEAH